MPDPILRTATGARGTQHQHLIRMAAAVDDDAAASGVYRTSDVLRADQVHADDDTEGAVGTIVGYPIVFDTWTEIHSWWEGDFLERIAPSAVDDTLARRGDRVKVQFNHGMDPQIGDKPLGKPRVQKPDSTGMWAETPLSDTSYNRDLAALIADGAIDGQSFRFTVAAEEWVSYGEGDDRPDYNPDGLDERTITRLNLHEHGPVTFPAYEATTLGLRSAAEVAEWRSGDTAKRETLVRLIAERAELRDIDPSEVLQRDLHGSPVVEDGPSDTSPAVTSDGEDTSDTRRADDPRPPGRVTDSITHAQRRRLAAQMAARVGAAYREVPA